MAYNVTAKKKKKKPGNPGMTMSRTSTDGEGVTTITQGKYAGQTAGPKYLTHIQAQKDQRQLERQGLKATPGGKATATLSGYDSGKSGAEKAATGKDTSQTKSAIAKLIDERGNAKKSAKKNAQAQAQASGKSPGAPMKASEGNSSLYAGAKKNVTSLFGKKQRQRGSYYRP